MAENGPEPAAEDNINNGTFTSDVPTEGLTSDVLSQEKLAEYRNAFAVFDKDGSNSISVEELKQVLVSLGKNPTDEEVETMIADVDEDGNGEIDFDEFIKLMEDEEKAFKTEDLMRAAFGVLDPDGEGYITVSRLKRVVEELGCEFTDEEISEMMAEADTSGNGQVEYRGLIGLMSTEDETLATAYKKREKIEEIKREEVVRQEAERIEKEDAERELEGDTDDAEEIEEHEIPDMEEIASQFDNEQYDKFSRQIPVGGRVVKRPGKKLPMSKTRMRYLQRTNKSLSTDGSTGESVYASMISLGEQESIRSGHQQEFRNFFKPDSDNWRLGTIQDESQTFEAKFTSNQPRQYKHIGSRLLDPKYYLKTPRASNDEQTRFESANIRAMSIDFDNELKMLREMNSKTAKSTSTLKTLLNSNGPAISQSRTPIQSYTDRAQREKLSREKKLYYAVWRSAFTKALERLRENKKIKTIQLKTPDLVKEQAKMEEKEKLRQKNRPKQTHRISVISPNLPTSSQKIVKESTTQRTRPFLNRGSYTDKLRKICSIEEKIKEQKEEQKQKQKPSTQRPRLAPLQKRGVVITKSGLNRMMKIEV